MTETVLYAALVVSAIGFLVSTVLFRSLRRHPEGEGLELSSTIRSGVIAYMRRLGATVGVIVVGVAILIVLLWGRPSGALAFLAGVVITGASSHVGILIASASNARATEAAGGGVVAAARVAFGGGAAAGLAVASSALAVAGLGLLFFKDSLADNAGVELVIAVLFGSATASLFFRVTGGIYSKAADVGVDLLAKLDPRIPDNDARNPAVVADSVGDNVGDVGGVGADLFSSFLGATAAPALYAALVFGEGTFRETAVVLPVVLAAIGIAASILGVLAVRFTAPHRVLVALHRGWWVALAVFLLATAYLTHRMFEGEVENWLGIWLAVATGLVLGWVGSKISEWFTSDHHKAVKEVARQSQTSPAHAIISGFSGGMRSAAFSLGAVAVGVGLAYAAGDWAIGAGGGPYGIALAATGLVSIFGMMLAMDAMGPIADNAATIARIYPMPPETRLAADAVDSVGKTNAALAKGYATVSATVTALALFVVLMRFVSLDGIDIAVPPVMIGLLAGSLMPSLVTSMTLNAVGRSGDRLIDEVRRQFDEDDGLSSGFEMARPDYEASVDVATRSALRETILPALMIVVVPIGVGMLHVEALGALLVGAIMSGFLLSIFMSNSGGAWGQSKRFIEAGAFGGRGGGAHLAAVVGDMLGYQFKDTAGPALNSLIKLMVMVALASASLFA